MRSRSSAPPGPSHRGARQALQRVPWNTPVSPQRLLAWRESGRRPPSAAADLRVTPRSRRRRPVRCTIRSPGMSWLIPRGPFRAGSASDGCSARRRGLHSDRCRSRAAASPSGPAGVTSRTGVRREHYVKKPGTVPRCRRHWLRQDANAGTADSGPPCCASPCDAVETSVASLRTSSAKAASATSAVQPPGCGLPTGPRKPNSAKARPTRVPRYR